MHGFLLASNYFIAGFEQICTTCYCLLLFLYGSTPCNLNNTSVIVLFTTFAGVDPHELLLETAHDQNISVFFGLPRPVTVYGQGFPQMDTKFLAPYKEFIRRTLLDHKFRYSHPFNKKKALLTTTELKILYTVVKGYCIDDGMTLADVHFQEIFLIKPYYKPLVDMLQNVSKTLAVGSSVQMNRFEENSTVDDNVKGFEALAKAGVGVISVAEGRGMSNGGYFWDTQLATPIVTVDMDLIASLTYKYPLVSPNATFDDVFWISVQKVPPFCHFDMSPVKRICVFEHSVMTNFNCACPAIQTGQGSGFLSEGSS